MRDRPGGPAPRVAFVGLLGGDADGGRNAAYSEAGTLFQERLIAAVGAAGVPVEHVFALRPIPSFPRSRRLWYGAVEGATIAGVAATLIPFVNVGPLKAFAVAAALVPRLVRWARRHPHDAHVILMYNVQNPPGLAGIIAARITGAATVAVAADVQIPGSGLVPDTWFRRVEFALQRATLPRVDGLVVLTDRIGADFAPRVPSMLMEGAAPDAAPPAPAHRPRVAAPFTLMYAGGLNELKGVPLLLEAFALLPGPGYRLWVTGAGPLRGTVEQAAALDARIDYRGFPPYAEVLAMYGQADLLVNPHSARHASARYVFPSKLLEYLATGTPVVSTVSTPEVLREYGGVIVPVFDDSAAELADAIARTAALGHAERAALGARARAFVLERKGWGVQGGRVAEFIRAVAERRA